MQTIVRATGSSFTPRLAIACVWVCLLASACASKDSDETTPRPNTASTQTDAAAPGSESASDTEPTNALPDFEYEACPADQNVGGFTLLLEEEFTSFGGKVSDAVLPSSVPVVIATDGDCSLLDTPPLSCEDCDVATEACSADGCVPLPVAHTLGEVTVEGLAAELTVMPNGRFSYTNPPKFPHPGFAPGAAIRLQSAGGDFSPLTLRGFGVSPLQLGTPSINLEPDRDAEITWTAPEVAGPTKVTAMLNVNRHGSSSGWIQCEAPDTGSLVISGQLLSALMDRGLSGWPTLQLRRQSADSTELQGAGCVELLVQAQTDVEVTIEGLISCNNPEDCPDDQICNMVLNCE